MKRYLSLLLILCMLVTGVDIIPAKAVTGTIVSGKVSLIQEGALVGTKFVEDSMQLRATRQTKTAKETIHQGIISMEESIDLSEYDLTMDDLLLTLQELINQNPDLFYIGNKVSATEGRDGFIADYFPDYLYSADEVVDMRIQLETATDLLMSGIEDSWSDLEKALYVHDYFVSQFSYDTTYTKYSMYNLLVEGSAVCQGYTLAYIHIMNLLGIPCVAVPSDAMGHIWNQVQIDGNWYHVDMTYDDPLPDIAGSVRHNNFLVSDTRIATQADNEHSGWISDYACTDTTYDNYFWFNSTAPFVYGGGKWYYVNTTVGASAGIYEWNPATGTSQRIVNLSTEKWYIDSGAYYNKLYSGLVCHERTIYYNTANGIYYFSVEQPEQIHSLTIPAVTGNIWGIQFKDYELKYSVGTDYNQISGMPTGVVFEKPVATVAPTAIPTVRPSETPEVSAEPVASPVGTPLPTTVPTTPTNVIITPPPGSVVMPSVTMTPEEVPMDVDSSDEETESISKSSIRITAKKGKRKFTVRVPKKVKTVIHVNKKIIRNKKKLHKKYNLSAKKNKTGKIKIRLSKKLCKGMKIRVTIYTKRGKITVKKNVKK